MPPVIALKGVCFSYGEHEVLHDVDFCVDPCSFLGVVGPNGGGKTTLLRLLLGLERPVRGEITVLGTTPARARGAVGYVMQHMQYDERFPATVLDIALMGRAGIKRWGPYRRGDYRIAAQALEQVGMSAYRSRPFASLSGGQRQRTLIAQALAVQPRLLLLDEPTANVDPDGEENIHRLLTALAREMTVISVSHNLAAVLGSVTHVLCVNRSVALSRLDDMNPEILEHARGGNMAVVHHALSCQIFDRMHAPACPPAGVTGRGEGA